MRRVHKELNPACELRTSLWGDFAMVQTNQTYNIQDKHKKPEQLNQTKPNQPWFSRLLRHLTRQQIGSYLMPRLHQDTSPGNMYPGRATCIRIHIMSTDTCRRIQVARSWYMLTVSWRHNYYSFMSKSSCIFCIQQQTGDKLATILSPIQDTCWRRQVDTSGYNLYPATCILV